MTPHNKGPTPKFHHFTGRLRGEGLSLADRLCLVLGERLEADVWTADTSWGSTGRIRHVR